MYKNIFINAEYDGLNAGEQIQGIDGTILIFGESAFASLEEALASSKITNSIVRVESGKYDYYVVDAMNNISPANQAEFSEFNGETVFTYRDDSGGLKLVKVESAKLKTDSASTDGELYTAVTGNMTAGTEPSGGNSHEVNSAVQNKMAGLTDITSGAPAVSDNIIFTNEDSSAAPEKDQGEIIDRGVPGSNIEFSKSGMDETISGLKQNNGPISLTVSEDASGNKEFAGKLGNENAGEINVANHSSDSLLIGGGIEGSGKVTISTTNGNAEEKSAVQILGDVTAGELVINNASENIINGGGEVGIDEKAVNISVSGNAVINNNGHLNANITAEGTLDVTNTSAHTLIGDLIGSIVRVENTLNGVVDGVTLNGIISVRLFNDSGATIKNSICIAPVVRLLGTGTYTNITVNTPILYLGGASVELNVISTVLTTKGTIYLASNGEGGNTAGGTLTISGTAGQTVNATIDGNNNGTDTGKIVFNTSAVLNGANIQNVQNVTINSGSTVTIASGTLNVDGTFTVNGKLSISSFNWQTLSAATSMTGTGTLELTHTGGLILNNGYSMDVTGFTGNVTMTQSGASLTLNKASAYFGNGATVTLASGQSLNLSLANKTTGIILAGTGTVNITENQTLTANNGAFTGTAVVSPAKSLTLTGNFGGTVNLVTNPTASTLVLNNSGIIVSGAVTGDANDFINVQQNATLSGNNIGFTGTANVTQGMTLTLAGNFGGAVNLVTNPTASTLILNNGGLSVAGAITGDGNDFINVQQSATLSGNNSGFTGTANVSTGQALTLNNSFGATAIALGGSSTLNLNSDNLALVSAITSTNANASINVQKNATLSGNNSGFTGTANVTQGKALTLAGNFGGTIDLLTNTTGSILNLNGSAVTVLGAIKGDAYDIINVQQSATLSGNNSGFTGTANVTAEQVLTLNNNFGASGIALNGHSTLNLNSNNLALTSVITGGTAAILNVQQNATLAGNNSGFTGTANVSTGQALTLNNSFGATAVALTGASTLNLNSNNLILASTITSTNANAVLNVQNNATLSGSNSGFTGTASISDGKSLTLNNSFGAASIALNGTSGLNLNKDGLNLASVLTGNASAVVNVQQNATLSGDNTGFLGTASVNPGLNLTLTGNFGGAINLVTNATGSTLNLNGNGISVLGAITGDANDIINVQKSTTLSGNNAGFLGNANVVNGQALTLNNNFGAAGIALNETGTLNLNSSGIALTSVISGGAAAALNVQHSATLSGNNTGFLGNANVANDQTLTLNGSIGAANIALNTTGTLNLNTASLGSNITGANAFVNVQQNATMSGDLSGFTGSFTSAATTVYTGTVNGTMNLNGTGTYNLSGAAVSGGGSLTLNSDASATNLVLGTKNATLAAGAYGTVTFGADGANTTLAVTGGVAATITGTQGGTGGKTILDLTGTTVGNLASIVTGVDAVNFEAAHNITVTSAGNINADSYNFLVNSATMDAVADLTVNGTVNFTGKTITVTADSAAAFTSNYTLIAGATGKLDAIAGITLTIGGVSQNLEVDGRALEINGQLYSLKKVSVGGTDSLVISAQILDPSNRVYVNSSWLGLPYTPVNDSGTLRITGIDAASSLDNAVSYIRNKVSEPGYGLIEIAAAGDYTIGRALMDSTNNITAMTFQGRSGIAASVYSNVIGSNGAADTRLTIGNLTIVGNVFGGASANAATVAANASGVTMTGGMLTGAFLAGGSLASGGGTVTVGTTTVSKNTSVTLNNTGTAQLLVYGRIIGGSIATDSGSIATQNGDTAVTVNLANPTAVRNAIYAAGAAVSGGTLNVNGNRTVTFNGSADNLSLTGIVSGGAFTSGSSTVNTKAGTTAELVFNNFTSSSGAAKFGGTLVEFNTVTFKGDTNMTFARRQLNSSGANLNFNLTGRTDTVNAMFTVRDSNVWEFGSNITISAGTSASGTYKLIGNYDFSGNSSIQFTVNNVAVTNFNQTYTDAGGNSFQLTTANSTLSLVYTKSAAAPVMLRMAVTGGRTSLPADNVDSVLDAAPLLTENSAGNSDSKAQVQLVGETEDIWSQLAGNANSSLTLSPDSTETGASAASDVWDNELTPESVQLFTDAGSVVSSDMEDIRTRKYSGALAS